MSRYRKSWTQVLQEVREDCEDCKCDPCECATPGENYPEGHEPQGIDDQYMDESAALQLKMAFDDAKIKIKGTKGGKLVISKKDKKKVEKVIAKQMKKPEDAKRVLGSQIVFEDVVLDEKTAKIGDGENQYGSVVYKRMKKDRMLKGWADKVKGIEVVSRDYLEKLLPDHVPGQLITKVLEEVELAEKGTAYPATVDTLKKIVKDKQNQTVMFDKGSAIVDLFSASAMVQVYDALKPATKKKFETMIKSKEGFMKSQAFAMKMAK